MVTSLIKATGLDLSEHYDYHEIALIGLLFPITILILLIGRVIAAPSYLLGRLCIWIVSKYAKE